MTENGHDRLQPLGRRDTARAIALAFGRFAIIWFGALGIGFPLVVLALGFKLREGWSLITAHRTVFLVLALFPFPLLAIRVGDELLAAWTEKLRKRNR